MKKLKILLGTTLLIALFFSACKEEPVSIRDRIDYFERDVSGHVYSNVVYKNFHPVATVHYNQYKAESAWIPNFTKDATYTITITSISGSTVDAKITGPEYSNDSIQFIMQKHGDDWQIKSLDIPVGGTVEYD